MLLRQDGDGLLAFLPDLPVSLGTPVRAGAERRVLFWRVCRPQESPLFSQGVKRFNLPEEVPKKVTSFLKF